jgi:lipopolysaccharide/colanic/teichoic acid biosynthesis glycosyltransferase
LQRIFDLICAALGLLILSPFLLVVALLIKLQDGGPIFYRAARVGKRGKEFRLYKFRTMVPDASKIGPAITRNDDLRVTRLGRVLRRWKLDEFPQLINVVKGDMAFVGPRPEDPCYTQYYTSAQHALLSVRPGITSPASMLYKDESLLLHGQDWEREYVNRILPHKLSIEAEYLKRRTFWTDFKIIVMTVLQIGGESRTPHR